MQSTNRKKEAFLLIDAANQQDPNTIERDGQPYPKALLYGQRMSNQLDQYDPQASEALQIAARAQHICRWEIPRSTFPMDRVGYNRWRRKLQQFHAEKAGDILASIGYESERIERVQFLLQKKQLKKDPETQVLEDVICLVFLEFYFDDFAKDHTEDKMIRILQKTWAKMSEKGRALALELPLSDVGLGLVRKALGA
ncbi:MAG: DUF4202 domain-containing protein [Bacteroidota bacterium]